MRQCEKIMWDPLLKVDFEKAASGMKLPVLIGRKEIGDLLMTDLTALPHLLIGGATGQGKSVFLETMLYGFLNWFGQDEIKFLLYDEKRVEFAPWRPSLYLERPVMEDPRTAVSALEDLVREGERRLQFVASAGCHDIVEYNAHLRGERARLPYLVFVADEMCELMVTEGRKSLQCISRLAELGRTVGIHLVLATQRPDGKVLSTRLKACCPGRIAFKVATEADSRQILGVGGAQNLNGRGDLRFRSGTGEIVRAQGVYIPSETLDDLIAESASLQAGPAASEDLAADYARAVAYVRKTKQATLSSFQRDLGFGFMRALSILDRMEQEGLVGPCADNHPRAIHWDRFPE